jgi:hypothetical protein
MDTDTEPVKLPPFGLIVGAAAIGWLMVNEALVSPLAEDPVLNALAFSMALLDRVIAPV